MKEKRKKEKRNKTKKSKTREKRNRLKSTSSSSSQSDEWVEKYPHTEQQKETAIREDWMSMTGMLKTYTKDDIKPQQVGHKKHIDSYDPAKSNRELNPYWKDGGGGLPGTPEAFRKSRPFIKPSNDDNYYSKSREPSISVSGDYEHSERYYKRDKSKDFLSKSYNWKHQSEGIKRQHKVNNSSISGELPDIQESVKKEMVKDVKYLSDEKMNKLAAKIVKAEIMGDTTLVTDLKAKLEAAREYRKQNPDPATDDDDDDRIMLMSTNALGNSRPLPNAEKDSVKSKSCKRKAETHVSGERIKYFGNDDKYNLAQMFQQEKYGNNYDNEAELAKIASKHKNPNDDLEDIFMDEISKNRNAAKENENEKHRAITQHNKMERSLEGCEYCVDSKNMLKHLIVSCGTKVYVSLPSRKSLVKDQCLITTVQHFTCVTSADEDVWEEILNYRKALTQFYNSQDKDVVFYETATKLHRYPHMVINCVPLPRDVGDMAAIYFKKALLECEAEWSMNKKVVDLKGKNIRRGIPKGLPYFWIDFGMDPGFAHVIEDQQLFPKTFAEEVIAGILDLDHNLWKNPRKEYGDVQRKKVVDFVKEWKPFDPIQIK